MQTKLSSLIETFMNIGSGFIIAWCLTLYVLPLWSLPPSKGDAFQITLMFTVVSMIRSYCWRRFFVSRTG